VSAVAPAAEQHPQATSCPRCGRPLAAEQDWCLECGAAARTVLALAAAFVALTRDDEPPGAPTGRTQLAPPAEPRPQP
jgi:hypothetical protein